MHNLCATCVDELTRQVSSRTCSFAKALTLPYLTAAAALCAGLWYMSKKATDDQLPVYAVAGVALWYCLLRGGINADIAGVATAMALPAPPPSTASGGAHQETLLDKLHHILAPWTAFIIMPIFALANTAVPFASTSLAAFLSAPVAQGIALGLILGKPLGIVAFSLVRCVAVRAQAPTCAPHYSLPARACSSR